MFMRLSKMLKKRNTVDYLIESQTIVNNTGCRTKRRFFLKRSRVSIHTCLVIVLVIILLFPLLREAVHTQTQRRFYYQKRKEKERSIIFIIVIIIGKIGFPSHSLMNSDDAATPKLLLISSTQISPLQTSTTFSKRNHPLI